jgi:light-regulated signal transduction histidine kinase (bacteriophytochrome)
MPETEKLPHQILNNEFIESAELNTILQSIPDAIYIGNLSGVKRSNQLALDMLGFESVEELNQHIAILGDKIKTRDLKTGKRLLVEEEPFVRALKGETVVQEVITTHIKTNKEIIVRCSASPVIYNGEVIGAIAINSDITEEVKNKRLLNETLNKLAIRNEELDKFVYTTSHDLKAPLISIGSLIDIIKEEYIGKPLGQEGLELLEMATEKVNHLNEFIHSLLDSAKTQKKQKEWIDLNEVLDKVIRNLNMPTEIQVFVKHNLPVIKYHKVSIMQVLQNILSNAVKYMDKEEKIIKIGFQETFDRYIFCVSDNGIGINKADYLTIFDKFKIMHTDPTIESSGIGLSIVKQIIEDNNGNIWVESEPAKGSTFYFTVIKAIE